MAKAESSRLNGASPRHYSPRRQHLHTQNQQLIEVEKLLKDFRILDADAQALHAHNRKIQHEEVDTRESARAKEHETVLKQAQEQRDAVRQQAEAILKKWEEEQVEEQQRRAEARAERERQAREEQEQLRRQNEERERAEAERQRQEQEAAAKDRQAQEAQAAEEAEAKRVEDERKQQEADKQTAAEEEAAAETQKQAQQQAEADAQEAARAASDNPEVIHQEYITLYYKTKAFKNAFWDDLRAASAAQANPAIKDAIGEARRLVKSEVGKLNGGDKGRNGRASKLLGDTIKTLLQNPAPVVGRLIPVNEFLPPSLNLNDNDTTTISDQGVWLLCTFVQYVVKIFHSYAHGAPERAEPIGLVASAIFGMPELNFPRPDGTTQSLFPILLAKYHRVCPVLFGITADQTTAAGKQKLGWALSTETHFVVDQTHYDRMTGLAIGYASIALRNFSKNRYMNNPYPPINFWRSLAQIINLEPEQVQPTHVCVLRHMFGYGGIGRFLLFFGNVGFAVLRAAFLDFPRRLPQNMQEDSYVQELAIYVELLGATENVHLV